MADLTLSSVFLKARGDFGFDDVELAGSGLTITQPRPGAVLVTVAGGGSGPPTLPASAGTASNLSLALEAFGQGVYINPSSGLVDAWTNNARPWSYWVPVGGTTSVAWSATGINGTHPALVVVNGDAPAYKAIISDEQSEDRYITPQAFTFAGTILYTGTQILNFASLRVAPVILGANADVPESPSVSIGLDPADHTKIQIVLWWTPDDVTYHSVASVGLALAASHYFVCTYEAPTPSTTGTLTMYADALPAVTTLAAPYSVLAQFQGQTLELFSNAISINSRLDANVGSIYAWNRALSATEIAQLQAYMVANGGF